MSTHTVTFTDGKLGRSDKSPVEPFTVDVPDGASPPVREAALVARVLDVARPCLASRDIEVDVSPGGDEGAVYAGYSVVGQFSIEPGLEVRSVTPGEFVEKAIALIGEDQGHLSIVRGVITRDGGAEWVVALEFGREAEDSPMVGGAAYGAADNLPEAVRQVAEQMRWS